MNNKDNRYKKFIYLFFLLLLLNGCSLDSKIGFNLNNNSPYVEINSIKINVEIADTDEERAKGLSGKKDLCADCGMLFVFPDKQARSFWMKNMNFPIDIIWIDDNEIIGIAADLAPEGDNPEKIYNSGALVNYVLEVNAGYVERNNIKKGDKVNFNY